MNKAERVYNRTLKAVAKAMGKTTTTTADELLHFGKLLFGDQFTGVYASDDMMPVRGYAILNTKPRKHGGEHWLAYADGLLYDSFGRKQYGDMSGDAEQKIKETNCGQRSLAWLIVYDQMGREAAATI